MRVHVITITLLSTRPLEPQIEILAKYKAAYGRLPKLDITAFNKSSAVPEALISQLLDLGYTLYEHVKPRMISSARIDAKRGIPQLGTDIFNYLND